MNGSFKIFWSQDGQKVCDISILEYKKEIQDQNGNTIPAKDSSWNPIYKKRFDWTFEKDQQGQFIQDTQKESKGWRLKFEFTDDGWKTKKIIFLQDWEIADFIAVINGVKSAITCKRENKNISIENQGTHSFVKFNQKDSEVAKFYVSKIDLFAWLRITALGLVVLQLEFKRDLGIWVEQKVLLESILNLNWWLTSSTVSTSSAPIKKEDPIVSSTTQNTSTDWEVKCTDCWHTFDLSKEQKVVDFSTKKFWTPVCYNCQQKRQG